MANYYKKKFLERVKPGGSVVDVVKAIYHHKVKGGRAYDMISKINAHLDGYIAPGDYKSLMKTTYTLWYNFVCRLNENNIEEGPTKRAIIRIKTDPSLNPANMSEDDCRNFIFNRYEKEFQGSGLRPMSSQSQSGGDLMSRNGGIYANFIHVHPFIKPDRDTECRLYINAKAENVTKIVELIMKEAYDNKKRFYGKFWTQPGRSDTLLIYTTYEKVEECIALIDRVKNKKDNLYLFNGCENKNPMLGEIDGVDYIGYGEDPQNSDESFNTIRAKAIDDFYADFFKDAYMQIGNDTHKRRAKDGRLIGIEQYIRLRLEKELINDIENKKQELLENLKNQNDVNIKKELAILDACLNQINGDVGGQLDKMTSDIMNSLKRGKRPTVSSLYFNVNGRQESYFFNFNIEKALLEEYRVEEYLEKFVTEEKLKPYFDKYHISVKHPYLSIESEEEYENIK